MKKKVFIKTAMEKLKQLRATQRNLRKEIDQLRDKIRQAGADPDQREVDYTSRNKLIYIAWKDGQSFKTLAEEHHLSTSRISDICRRIDLILETKRHHFEKYKDLLPYK